MRDAPPELMRVLRFASGHLSSLDDRRVAETLTAEELRVEFVEPMPASGSGAEEIVEHLISAADGGMVTSTGARFFGWVMGGTLPSALAADWLVSTWDQNAATAATSPASAIIEEVVGDWLRELLGLHPTTSYALTTGCQMSHTTCLAAARNAVLARCGWDVERDGLQAAPRVRLLTGSNVHASVGRSVRLLGFGSAALEILPEGAEGTLQPDLLEAALRSDRGPQIVILQAGDLNIGAFDEFRTLIAIAHAAGAWVHIDGAFGLWARASERRRYLTDGLELADSIATDAHKWLNVPYDSGIAFIRDPAPHLASMQVKADYIAPRGDIRDPIDWTPDWSRRARSIPIYAALRELGRDGVAEIVDRTCDLAHDLALRIGALDGARLEREPQINQAIIYFPDERPEATGADQDIRTKRVIELINIGGEAYFTGTRYRGRSAMRLSVSNWRIQPDDVDRTVAAVERAISLAREEASA
jgi:glutamate/tyrosine decarboxylase-like PLP-dependent enzyme